MRIGLAVLGLAFVVEGSLFSVALTSWPSKVDPPTKLLTVCLPLLIEILS